MKYLRNFIFVIVLISWIISASSQFEFFVVDENLAGIIAMLKSVSLFLWFILTINISSIVGSSQNKTVVDRKL